MKSKILLLLLPLFVFAQGNIFSNIPPAKIEVININPEFCDESCLFELSNNKKIFSFVARFDKSIQNKELQNLMEIYSSEIGIYYKLRFDPLGKTLEIALLIPKKIIGKYSTTTIDTILAYLLSRDIDFRFKIFDSVDENLDSLNATIEKINNEHFNFVVAVLSKKESLEALDSIDIPIYIPTMTNKDIQAKSNIVFGGIDYELQVQTLINQEDGGITIIYNDDSSLGRQLGEITKSLSKFVFIEDTITNRIAANFSQNLEREEMFLAGSNVFLNTPVVKSGLLLSQIGISSEKPNNILSTQVNFNPALLSLIRGNDTSNILIVSSIGDTNQKLIEYGLLLTSDMKYDWVNYSTALGVDLFLSNMSQDIEKYFVESFDKNQAIYNISLYRIHNGIFVKLDEDEIKKVE
ncbi:hypothetical protein CCY99_08275 [Helicobacter sp. 16-1353]|uniref:hypothetical protein n=1 Tax=Helicobacter sp. 16-1353 TaxID=2004996 RepID=UPI000DCB915C|nr:hypothetical protein [Helicobacter sp. 16-1353]RAX51786.1 hypothetical protein CCY99_08275 [Helicobacter sp. 16-1353]